MRQPRLKLVAPAEPIDIHAKAKAEIAARDWNAVHVWADKQKPVEIGERRRGWR